MQQQYRGIALYSDEAQVVAFDDSLLRKCSLIMIQRPSDCIIRQGWLYKRC